VQCPQPAALPRPCVSTPKGSTSLASVLGLTTMPVSPRASGYTGDTGAFAIAGHAPLLPLYFLMSPARLALSFAHSPAQGGEQFSGVPVPALSAAYTLALPSHSAILSPRLSNATSCIAIAIAIRSVATTIRVPHSDRRSPQDSAIVLPEVLGGQNAKLCIAEGIGGLSRAVLAPPSLSYKPVTSAPRDCGNISHDPTHDSSRDPFATCTSRDLSARDPGNLRPRDPGKITHDLSRNWSSTMSHDKTRFGRASNLLINTWKIVGTINKTCPLNNQRTCDAT